MRMLDQYPTGLLLIITLCYYCFYFSPTGYCSGGETFDDFYHDAYEKWGDYIDEISRMECSFNLTTSYYPKPESKTEFNIVFDYPNYAIEIKENDLIKSVVCFGKKYRFRLNRNEETGSYDIIELMENEQEDASNFWKDIFFLAENSDNKWLNEGGSSLRFYLGQELILWGPTDLPKLLQYEHFSIERFTDDGDKILIEYKFEPEEYATASNGYNVPPIRSGHFVLFRDSLLVESAVFLLRIGDDFLDYTIDYEYETTVDKTELKKKTVVAKRVDDANFIPHTTIFEYDNIKHKKQPLSRFRLSYYGLPEPRFENIGVTFWRIIFTLLGIVIIVYIIIIICKTHKEQKNSKTPEHSAKENNNISANRGASQ